jgi:hypothetical protein
MIRFVSLQNDPLRGTHMSICWTSYCRTLAAACDEMQTRVKVGAVARAPLFYDFGPGDSDLRRLDQLPCWPQTASA